MNNKRRTEYEILNETLSKNNMNDEVRNARWGRDVDDSLTKCMSIICPDVMYELSRGKDIRNIVDWLKKFTDYGMEYFTEYSKRVEKESKAVIYNLEYNKRVELLDIDKVENLPHDMKIKILSYIPMKERGITIMCYNWVEIEYELRKMKGCYLNKMIDNIKRVGRIYPSMMGVSSGEISYEAIRSVNSVMDKYTYNLRKELKLGWLKDYINKCLRIDIRSNRLKNMVIENGYKTILLLKYLIKKKGLERENMNLDRKEKKKIKRRERIKKAKENKEGEV
jgi:hypothetical protein